jgi:hypothetical protein
VRKASNNEIYANDWFKDRAGKTWAVVSIDVERRVVRLRMVDPPERVVSVEVLRKSYTLAGLRAVKAAAKGLAGK